MLPKFETNVTTAAPPPSLSPSPPPSLSLSSILHRAEDPVQFCRLLLDSKVSLRNGAPFTPDQPSEYVRQSYADASANADESGRIMGKKSANLTGPGGGGASGGGTQGGGVRDVDGLTNRLALLENLIEACRTIATKLDPIEAVAVIVSQTIKVLEADRATIFTLDNATKELVLVVVVFRLIIAIAVLLGRGTHRLLGRGAHRRLGRDLEDVAEWSVEAGAGRKKDPRPLAGHLVTKGAAVTARVDARRRGG